MAEREEPIRILQCVSNMDRAGIETMLMNFYRNIDRDKIIRRKNICLAWFKSL